MTTADSEDHQLQLIITNISLRNAIHLSYFKASKKYFDIFISLLKSNTEL